MNSACESSQSAPLPRQPRLVLSNIYGFPPNRSTLGATAYFIVEKDAEGNPANLLVDCPPQEDSTTEFIQAQGGVRWWVLTHRDGHGTAATLQRTLQCPIVVQEQEAYLLPEVPHLHPYRQELALGDSALVIWTPGYSPGSACLYYRGHGGVLFTGRHLLPTPEGQILPLRFSKTFHWPRQLQQVRHLQERFTAESLAYLCPGANTGFLRGQRLVADAYSRLQDIDVEGLGSHDVFL
ncbi:Zn-dependent hydrolase, glyoxylase [Leptolyngbya sp. PCC 6406]|uniref:Zn-dependent hydrolase, glyoxylase n=1 Tax=Leptolyngbya sp. PCC 6406 TaxID=1173264 RepID=UPI0002ACAFC3|nr:Zn-dependent hydrolase, glyoxylase [Leptolyngbya sp. PCC 6406]